MQIVHHPGWTGPGWPGLESEPARQPDPILWLAVALAVAITGLALGLLAATALGASLALVALPFAVAGLWLATAMLIYEIGGYRYEAGYHDSNH